MICSNFLLEIDIYRGNEWVDSCPREMLEIAKLIYPEELGFRYGDRRHNIRNTQTQQEKQA